MSGEGGRGDAFDYADNSVCSPGRVKRPCTLQFLCYNADTIRKNFKRKGLPVSESRLFPHARLLLVIAALGMPFAGSAQTTAPRGPGQAQQPLSLSQKSTTSAPKKSTSAAARRRAAARARAAAAARTAREAEEPKFKLDDSGQLVPDLRAEAAIIYDPATGHVLWEQNSTNERSIASITKVMTAVVFLESSPDLTEQVVVQRADVRNASTTYIRAGYKLTKSDLLHLTLIASDNAAARVLARVSPQGSTGFIDRMNEKASELGLTATHYSDPSGLLSANVSSAYDMARLIAFVGLDERIASVMRKPNHSIQVGSRTINIHSTNQLVMKGDVDVLGGKTGFIRAAGYCLATLLRLPQGGPQVAVVVLGARSNAGRFWETRHLFNWMSARAQAMLATPVEAASVTN